MASFTKPVLSSIGGLEFGFLSNEDIKAVSVKRIHNTPTLDSFNNPVPGGLYDPALGAWEDHVYATRLELQNFGLLTVFADALRAVSMLGLALGTQATSSSQFTSTMLLFSISFSVF